MTKYRSLISTSFILLFYLLIVDARGPIIIPKVDQIEGIVENLDTHEFVPLNGGLVWLLCSDYYPPGENVTVTEEPCHSNLKIYTPIPILNLMSIWIDENGFAIPFQNETNITLVTREKTIQQPIPIDTTNVDVELDLKNSYANLELSIGDWKRVIEIVHDNQEPSASVDFYSAEVIEEELVVRAAVEFNELVFEVTDDKDIYCSLNMTSYPYNISTTEIIEQSKDCFITLQESDLIDIIVEINLTEVKKLHSKVLDQHIVYISAIYTNITVPADIKIKIEKGAVFDYAGNKNTKEHVGTEYYRPTIGRDMNALSLRLRNREIILNPSRSIVDGALVGSVASAAVGVAVGTSFAGSTFSGGDPSSISLINGVQKLHLTGMLAVTQMPDNYKNFTDSMAWAVLDFGSSGNSTNEKSDKNITSSIILNNDTTTNDKLNLRRRNLKQDFFEAEDDENELDYFYRIFFWVPLIFLLLLIFHILALLYLFIKERPFWPILEFPRLELMFAFFAMPIISIASAGLYLGTRTEAMIATWLLIMFPTSFTVFGIFMIWYHFFVLKAEDREVNLVLSVEHKKTILFKRLKNSIFGEDNQESSPVPMKENAIFDQLPSSSRHETINNINIDKSVGSSIMKKRIEGPSKIKLDPDNFRDYMTSFWMNFKKDWGLTIILGQRQEDAAWVKTKDPKSTLIIKYGPLFEEFRGPPVIVKEGTLEYNPMTGKIDRGKIIKLRDMPVFKLPNIKIPFRDKIIMIPNIHRFHLQVLAKILDFIRLILVGCVISGVGSDEDNMYELISLLVITILIIVIFRVSKPFHSRMDMGIMWLAESVDIITYSCAIAILRRTDSDDLSEDFLLNIGFGLMLAQGIALLVSVIEKILLGTEIVFTVKDIYEDRKKSPFCEFAYKLMVKNGRFLERKYGDKWMVKTFKRGLKNREPSREELPWRFAAKRNIEKVSNSFEWFFRELSIILLIDHRNRRIKKSQKLQGQLSVSLS